MASGVENVFLFLAAKSKNKHFLYKSNINLPTYVDFRECTVPHNLDTRQSVGPNMVLYA
jgi:hypothetical protein